MSKLHSRIAGQAGANRAAAAGYHPWGTADTPLEMPAVHVWYNPAGMIVQQTTGIVTPNGAVIPATPAAPVGHVPMTGNYRRG